MLENKGLWKGVIDDAKEVTDRMLPGVRFRKEGRDTSSRIKLKKLFELTQDGSLSDFLEAREASVSLQVEATKSYDEGVLEIHPNKKLVLKSDGKSIEYHYREGDESGGQAGFFDDKGRSLPSSVLERLPFDHQMDIHLYSTLKELTK